MRRRIAELIRRYQFAWMALQMQLNARRELTNWNAHRELTD